jgi:hypothetical protein
MAMKPQMDYAGPDMPAGAPEAAPQGPAPEQGKGAMGAKDVLGAIKTIESAMAAIASSLEKAGAPQEAVDSLQAAIAAYGQFVSAITGGEAPQEAKPAAGAPAPMETAGASGPVVPEGMPTR